MPRKVRRPFCKIAKDSRKVWLSIINMVFAFYLNYIKVWSDLPYIFFGLLIWALVRWRKEGRLETD